MGWDSFGKEYEAKKRVFSTMLSGLGLVLGIAFGMSLGMLLAQARWALAASPLSSKPDVIYGKDDRVEPENVREIALQRIAASTLVMVYKRNITEELAGLRMDSHVYGEHFDLCRDERFYDQPAAGECSAFLVGEDMVATAGHCVSETNCAERMFMFGFQMKAPLDSVTIIPKSEAYSCKRVMARSVSETVDFALVQLDRKVLYHAPLKLALDEPLVDQEMRVIGYPAGLPLKIVEQARVRRVEDDFLSLNSDTFGGSSGSPVVNAKTLEVVGLIARGETDFEFDAKNRCSRSHRCEDDACDGEEATHIRFVREALAQQAH